MEVRLPVIEKIDGCPLAHIPIFDTYVAACVIYPNMKEIDFRQRLVGMPLNLYGSHSLEAWGWRRGDHKGNFGKKTDWKEWSEEMEIYCVQDR